jgi:cellulose biosynthesis protein BcsQ
MLVTVYNVKGGAGKTPISVNIALDKGWAIATNEPYHVLDGFDPEVLPDDRVLSVPMEKPFPKFPDTYNVVFDLAGSISTHAESIKSAIAQSDLVIVPIYNEIKCLTAGLHTINEVSSLNSNIVVAATKLQKKRKEVFTDWSESGDCTNIREYVERHISKKIKVFPLKFSTAFERIFEDEKSILQLMDDDPLLGRAYQDVAKQFDDLYDEIERVGNAK